jgi:hypothetical protein
MTCSGTALAFISVPEHHSDVALLSPWSPRDPVARGCSYQELMRRGAYQEIAIVIAMVNERLIGGG